VEAVENLVGTIK